MEGESDVGEDSYFQKKYPDLKGQIIHLTLEAPTLSTTSSSTSSSPSSLPHHRVGLHLAGHKDLSIMSTFIVGIEPFSVAEKDGRLKVGDELLEVNGQVVYNRSHLNSSAIIKSISSQRLALLVHRCEEALENMAVVPMETSAIVRFQKDLDHETTLPPSTQSDSNIRDKQKIFRDGKDPSLDGKRQQHGGTFTSAVSVPTGMSDASVVKESRSVQPEETSVDLPSPERQGNRKQRNNLPKFPSLDDQPVLAPPNPESDHVASSSSAPPFASPPESSDLHGGISRVENVEQTVLNDEAVNGGLSNAASRQCSSVLPHSDSLASTDIPFDNEDDDDDDDDISDDLLNNHQEDILSSHPHHQHRHHLYHHGTTNQSGDAAAGSEEIPLRTCQIVAGGKPVVIEVDRNNLPVGLLLFGGQDTAMKTLCIKEIMRGGAAEQDGRLKVGDEILEINGENADQFSPSKAQHAMQKSPSSLRLRVKRDSNQPDPLALMLGDRFFYDSFTVEVFRKLGKGLGICLRSRMGDKGAVVSHIIRGGAAEADGRLSVGDEITTVNGEDVVEAKVMEVFERIKIMTGRISLRVIRLKRSMTTGVQGSSISDHSLIGGFKKSFKRKQGEQL